MNRFDKIIYKLVNPNLYIRSGGALIGGTVGYYFSKSSKEITYKEVPEKLHIAPTILTGTVCALFPIIPFVGTVGFALITVSYSYCSWERKVLEETKKTS